MDGAVLLIIVVLGAVGGGVAAVLEIRESRKNEIEVLPWLIRQLETAPLDSQMHAAFLGTIRSLKLPAGVTAGGPAYNAALRILEENPGECLCKQFVLDVGRWHFGRGRPGGAPTSYDEQAILNDILVRSQPSLVGASL